MNRTSKNKEPKHWPSEDVHSQKQTLQASGLGNAFHTHVQIAGFIWAQVMRLFFLKLNGPVCPQAIESMLCSRLSKAPLQRKTTKQAFLYHKRPRLRPGSRLSKTPRGSGKQRKTTKQPFLYHQVGYPSPLLFEYVSKTSRPPEVEDLMDLAPSGRAKQPHS